MIDFAQKTEFNLELGFLKKIQLLLVYIVLRFYKKDALDAKFAWHNFFCHLKLFFFLQNLLCGLKGI